MAESIATLPDDLNLYLRIFMQRNKPVLPERKGFVEIWIRNHKFRVRDGTGRYLFEILDDIRDRSGLGAAPGSLEEIMDIHDQASNRSEGDDTEIFADLESDHAVIRELGQSPRASDAAGLLPIATQIFSNGAEPGLQQTGTAERLGRECIDYSGLVTFDDAGAEIRVLLSVSNPYIIYSRVQDPQNENHCCIREVVDLQEGIVTEADVALPEVPE